MTFEHPAFGVLKKAGIAVLLWLVSASASYAAHAPRHSRRICDPHTTTIRHFPRKPKTFGGPLARPSVRTLAGLTDPLARLVRGSRETSGANDDAIQDDSPAAHQGVDPVLELRAIGLFVDTPEQHLHTRTFSPRSPRGPPAAA